MLFSAVAILWMIAFVQVVLRGIPASDDLNSPSTRVSYAPGAEGNGSEVSSLGLLAAQEWGVRRE